MVFVKYPDVIAAESDYSILDNPVKVFEKVDGGNCQFRKIDGILKGGNRSGFLDNKKLGNFWFLGFHNWLYSNISLTAVPEHYVFFGEWTAKHAIEYLPEFTDKFFLVDVLDLETGKIVDYKESATLVNRYSLADINVLRTLKDGKASKGEIDEMMAGSDYYSGNKEGLVVKDYENQRFMKFLGPDFSEIDHTKDGLERYLTRRRIEKMKFAMLGDGEEDNMKTLVRYLMADLRKEAGIFPAGRDVEEVLNKLS